MKVSQIINTINTYNNINKRLTYLTEAKIMAEAFEDDVNKEEIQKEIDKTSEELGNFLNMEV